MCSNWHSIQRLCGGTDGSLRKRCQISMPWLRFEKYSIRVQVQRATLSYVIGSFKISKCQLKCKGFLPRSQNLACLLACLLDILHFLQSLLILTYCTVGHSTWFCKVSPLRLQHGVLLFTQWVNVCYMFHIW